MRPTDAAPLAVTTRSGVDESVHFGIAVAAGADGRIVSAVGDPDAVIYPRSSNKPAQAVAMVRHGLALPAELLALVCASHAGSSMHTAAALQILARAGLDEGALGNTAGYPLDPEFAAERIRAGLGRSPLTMNCSGKHAGMLATCVANSWPVEGYLSAEHPLQRSITATLAELAGGPAAHVGVDGCGAPAHAMTVRELMTMFRTIATAADPAERQIRTAMTTAPHMVAGEHQEATMLMRGVPGLIAKDGADGVFAAALPDGSAVALKVADGGDRARVPVMLDLLQTLGVDVDALRESMRQPILGHGKPVGEVRSLVGRR